MATFPDAVRSLPDDELVALLRARPDLASPSPSTLRSLAARASSRTSLERALAQLDTPTLQVLEAVAALERHEPRVDATDVAAAVGAGHDVETVARLLDRAQARALLWVPEHGGLRTAPGLDEVLSPPLGPAGHLDLEPPRPSGTRPVPPPVTDGEAASAALEAVRLVDVLLATWQDAPPPVLRSGGLAVRELRRTAQALGLDDATAASVIELAASAGLVDDDGEATPSYVPTTVADTWDEATTTQRWAMLAAAWAGSRRTPWLVGTRDEKGAMRSALSTGLGRGWVPRLRVQVLVALDALGAITARPGDVGADLAWRAPRAVPPQAAVEGLLREAALLGVTGAGALAATGRALLAVVRGGAGPDAEGALAHAVAAVLPEPVDDLLLQGDLTGVVPGRPSPVLADLIERAAEVESRGAATTVRFTPASVTRALDAGDTADELLGSLARLSRTPVPQALDYLVRDTARRHGALRVGAAGSYVRVTDPAALAGLVEDPRLAELGLVRLAPTVLASSAPAATLQAALRARGAPAALEGPDGRPLGRLRRRARIERGGHRTVRSPYLGAGAPSSDDERRTLVEQLRIADGQGPRSPFASTAGGTAGVSVAAVSRGAAPGPARRDGSTPADALAVLHDAVREGSHVWVELVDGHGRAVRRRVRPVRVDGGRLRALDPQRGSELTVAVHRIAAVDPDDD